MRCFRGRWGGRGGMAAAAVSEHPQGLLYLIDVITNQAVCGETTKAQVPCASYRISVSRVLFFVAFRHLKYNLSYLLIKNL
jgi:hypothetical protein